MPKCVPKVVTYVYEQYLGAEGSRPIDELLFGTRVNLESNPGSAYLRYPAPPYSEAGYVENGPAKRLWYEDYVVVSSLGEVRILNVEAFDLEFDRR